MSGVATSSPPADGIPVTLADIINNLQGGAKTAPESEQDILNNVEVLSAEYLDLTVETGDHTRKLIAICDNLSKGCKKALDEVQQKLVHWGAEIGLCDLAHKAMVASDKH